jgi:hypothetical protein
MKRNRISAACNAQGGTRTRAERLRWCAAEAKVRWTVGTAVVLVWLLVSMALRERVLRPLQTPANLLGRFARKISRCAGAGRELATR